MGRLLQKKGLLSSHANLSKAKPSYLVRKKIHSLSGIFNGTQQALPVTDVMLPKYKAAGYRTIGRQVILDKQPRQRFVRRKSDIILEETDRSGGPVQRAFETILFPLDVRSLPGLVEWIREDPDRFMALLPPGTAFAFTFHGHNSRQIFSDPLELADYLETYFAGTDAWQHFTMYRLINPAAWQAGLGHRKSFKRRSGKARSAEYKRYYQYNKEKKRLANKKYYQMLKSGRK